MSSDEDGGGGSRRSTQRKRAREKKAKKDKEAADESLKTKSTTDAQQQPPSKSNQSAADRPVRKFTLRDQPVAPLTAREASAVAVIAKEVGKVKNLGGAAALEVGAAVPDAGFFCEKCGKLLKDSQSWLNHLNSKKHLIMSGTGIRAIKSSTDEVLDRLKSLEQQTKGNSSESRRARSKLDAFGKETDDEDLEDKKIVKKPKPSAPNEDDSTADDPELAMMKAMGFATSFAAGKKT